MIWTLALGIVSLWWLMTGALLVVAFILQWQPPWLWVMWAQTAALNAVLAADAAVRREPGWLALLCAVTLIFYSRATNLYESMTERNTP
jgi:hypothetical protein